MSDEQSKTVNAGRAEQPTPAAEQTQETTTCDGFCSQTVFEAATVDVVAGAVVGEWNDPEHHVGVTGVETHEPEVETWCTTCANEAFGIQKSASEKRIEQTKQYVTASNVTSFLLGVTLVMLVVLLFP